MVIKAASEDDVLVDELPRIPQYMLFPSLPDPQKPARKVTFSPYIKFQLIPARNVESDFSSSPEPLLKKLLLQVSQARIHGKSDGDVASTENEESAKMSVSGKVIETQEMSADEKVIVIKDIKCEIDSLS